MMTMTGEQL